MTKFTDFKIAALQPKAKAYKAYEKASDPGFHVQVTPAGRKVFYMAYTLNGKKRFFNLGTYSSEYSLAEARVDCRTARSLVDRGIDPAVDKQQRLAEQENARKLIELERTKVTVDELLNYYLESLNKESTRNDARLKFAKEVRPVLGNNKACDVSDKDIRPIITKIVNRGAQVSARHLHTFLHAAFNLAIKDDFSPFYGQWNINPVSKVKKPDDTEPDKRVLSIQEIRIFWKILDIYDGMEPGMKDSLRLLFATGQRVQEVLNMRWDEINWETMLWTIPPSRIKTRKKRNEPHVLPITNIMETIIRRQPLIGDAVFPGRNNPEDPFQWRSLSRAVTRMVERTDVAKFTPRQIRGTVKTHMARIGVLKEIRDRIQNHALVDVATTHYDAYDYLDEKRAGLTKWQVELNRINTGERGNVVQLKA